MAKLRLLVNLQRSLRTWIVDIPGDIGFLGLIILIRILRLRNFLPLVPLTTLVDSPPSLVQALFGQIKRTFEYVEMVIVANRVAL